MKERIKAILRALIWRLLKLTAPPYECYWRDRAFAAEKKLRNYGSYA